MIRGVVLSHEARCCLKVRGPRGREQEIKAIIDTGYTASLTLPSALIASIGLRWKSFERVVLADGNESDVNVYEALVVWDGQERRILVDESESDPLVGMEHASPPPGQGDHQTAFPEASLNRPRC